MPRPRSRPSPDREPAVKCGGMSRAFLAVAFVQVVVSAFALAQAPQGDDLPQGTSVQTYDLYDFVANLPPLSPYATDRRSMWKAMEEVIELLQETVSPESWVATGGDRNDLMEDSGRLVVS